VVGDNLAFADLNRRGVDLDRFDHTELAQVADVIVGCPRDDAGGALGAGAEAQDCQQVGRRLMGKLGVELDVEMVVLVALPGVNGGAESRDQAGTRHAKRSLQSVDDCL
jgi:hypothetical protein